jgi:superfamily II DNA/RNA helicase
MHKKMNLPQVDDKILTCLKKAGYKAPTPLQEKIFPVFSQNRDIIVEVNGAKGKGASFIIPLITVLDSHQDQIRALVITSDAEEARKTVKEFSKCSRKNSSSIRSTLLISDSKVKGELDALSNHPDIIIGTPQRIIDHIRRENIDLSYIERTIITAPNDLEEDGFDHDIDFIFSKIPGNNQKLFYAETNDSVELIEAMVKKPLIVAMDQKQTQEKTAMKSKENTVDEKEVESKITDLIRIIKEEENPDILNSYRKLFKKYTPFAMRGYLSAYLLLHAGKQQSRPSRHSSTDPDKTSLFISVGKNRRVYPKDLVKLFQSRLNLDQSDIGPVKVLESYSFMEISKVHADKAIEAVNGTEFKGRKLTVNHARKKNSGFK